MDEPRKNAFDPAGWLMVLVIVLVFGPAYLAVVLDDSLRRRLGWPQPMNTIGEWLECWRRGALVGAVIAAATMAVLLVASGGIVAIWLIWLTFWLCIALGGAIGLLTGRQQLSKAKDSRP
jgi:hypothetical protein